MSAAVLPAAKIGSGLLASWIGSKLNKNPVGGGQVQPPVAQDYSRSPAGQTAYNALNGVAGQQTAEGTQTGAKVGSYYRALIGGNKAAVNAAVAPERNQISETYRGAEEGANRLRGPARDRAKSKLNLQKAGQLGALPYAARRDAVAGAGQLAQNQISTGASLYDRALGSEDRRAEVRYGDVRDRERLGLEGARINLANAPNQAAAGAPFGSFFYDILSGLGGGGGKGAGSVNGLPILPFARGVSPVRP